jgi:hypothetical protein
MAVRGAASRDGEGENSLPTPSADSDAHFSSSARGGGRVPPATGRARFGAWRARTAPLLSGGGTGRRYEARDATPAASLTAKRASPAKTAPHVWKHHRDVRMMWHGASM